MMRSSFLLPFPLFLILLLIMLAIISIFLFWKWWSREMQGEKPQTPRAEWVSLLYLLAGCACWLASLGIFLVFMGLPAHPVPVLSVLAMSVFFIRRRLKRC